MKLPSLIGVIHLPALPGAPGAAQLHPVDSLRGAAMRAVAEAKALAQAGFDGIILENFGDTPFYKSQVPPETIASLAFIAAAVRETVKIPIGVNVLRNDARAALAIAAVTGCDFIRVNVLVGVVATDQGLIEGQSAELARERDRLGASVAIIADAQVKHARSLSSEDLALEMEEIVLRAGADGVIITGATTGREVSNEAISAATHAMRKLRIPVWVGSGTNAENVSGLRGHGFGIIVGSDLRVRGKAGAALDPARIRAFMKAARTGVKRKAAPKKSRTKKK
jgi:membrane complex biogenesis BtpA family protein